MYHFLLIKIGSDKLLIEALNASLTQVTATAHIQLRRTKKLFHIVSVSLNKKSNTHLKS